MCYFQTYFPVTPHNADDERQKARRPRTMVSLDISQKLAFLSILKKAFVMEKRTNRQLLIRKLLLAEMRPEIIPPQFRISRMEQPIIIELTLFKLIHQPMVRWFHLLPHTHK